MAGNGFRKALKSAAAVILSAVLVLAGTSATVRATDAIDQLDSSISQNETKRAELEQKNQELTQKLEDAKKNAADAQALHQAYQDKIAVVQQQMDDLQQQADAMNQEINDLKSQISNREASIAKNTELLKERIRAIYMAGETSTLDILLGATDFNDFLDKASLLKTITDHDTRLIETLKAEMSKLSKEQETYDQKKTELDGELQQLKAKNDELQQLSQESGVKVAEYREQEQEATQGLDHTSAELEQLSQDISAYYEQLRLEYERQQQEAQNQKPPASSGQEPSDPSGGNDGGGDGDGNGGETTPPDDDGGSSPSPDPEPDPGPDPSSPHNYSWPVPGFYWLSSMWNEDRDSYNHGAIDIAGAGIYGTPIYAAHSGTINTIWYNNGGWGGGYGTYCMIDNDQSAGYSTLYAHMSSIAVSPGQYVQQGQVIGYVGSTGDSSGPHLHLETRYWGDKYNPLTEFPGVDWYT